MAWTAAVQRKMDFPLLFFVLCARAAAMQMRAAAADTRDSAEQKASELRDKAADKAGEVSRLRVR